MTIGHLRRFPETHQILHALKPSLNKQDVQYGILDDREIKPYHGRKLWDPDEITLHKLRGKSPAQKNSHVSSQLDLNVG